MLEDIHIDPQYIGSFDTALFLNKAMSRNAETAINFTHNLAEWDIIDEEFAGRPMALAKNLIGQVYSFQFRSSGDKRFQDPEEGCDMSGFSRLELCENTIHQIR